jgi:hypothetical protein
MWFLIIADFKQDFLEDFLLIEVHFQCRLKSVLDVPVLQVLFPIILSQQRSQLLQRILNLVELLDIRLQVVAHTVNASTSVFEVEA